MKKILFYPGTFNPPHLGHALTVEAALKSIDFDEVWIMPSGKRVDREMTTSSEDRKNLGSLFVEYLKTETNIPVKLITIAVDEVGGKYTHEVIMELKAESNDEIFQLCGIDGFLAIKERVIGPDEKYVIHKRPGYEFPDNFVLNSNLVILNSVSDVSSTKVREMIKNGNEEYKKLVPEEVALYIEEKKLYL